LRLILVISPTIVRLTESLIGLSIGLLIHWLIDWLIDRLIDQSMFELLFIEPLFPRSPRFSSF
jgi:NhaP-type Na+/H+ or K+/H+ antiporter